MLDAIDESVAVKKDDPKSRPDISMPPENFFFSGDGGSGNGEKFFSFEQEIWREGRGGGC